MGYIDHGIEIYPLTKKKTNDIIITVREIRDKNKGRKK